MTHNLSGKHLSASGTAVLDESPFMVWLSSWSKHQNGPPVRRGCPAFPAKHPLAKAPEPQLTSREERCCDMATD